MADLTKRTTEYHAYSEPEATKIVEDYKANAAAEGYTVIKSKINYKQKKDRKTGEVIEEVWIVEVTVSYEI